MSTPWNWPGSRWWRIDLHTHSPASYDFGTQADRANPDWPEWVKAVRDAGLDAAGITDHNTAAAIGNLKGVATELEDAPALFPGVELTASDGVHLLLLMGPNSTQQHVEDLLTKAAVPVELRGGHTARSSLSVEEILKRCGDDALIIGAHVNGPDGLLGYEGQQRLAVLRHRNLAAVEINPDEAVDESWLDGSRPEVGRRLSRVWCSDGHSLAALGRRFTWVKMTRPRLEGPPLGALGRPRLPHSRRPRGTGEPEYSRRLSHREHHGSQGPIHRSTIPRHGVIQPLVERDHRRTGNRQIHAHRLLPHDAPP